MYMRIGLTDGRILNSDVMTDDELNEFISDSDGHIGSGDFAEVRIKSVEDAIAFMERLFSVALEDVDGGKVSIVVNGESQEYPSTEVGWYRFVR